MEMADSATITYTSQIEDKVLSVAGNTVKTKRSVRNLLNKYKRRWRKRTRPGTVPIVYVQPYPADVISLMNSNFERYEESIQLLVHSRASVLDKCRVTYKHELSGKLEQCKASMLLLRNYSIPHSEAHTSSSQTMSQLILTDLTQVLKYPGFYNRNS